MAAIVVARPFGAVTRTAHEKEDEDDEGEEDEGHSDDDHKECMRQESPSRQPHMRPRTHAPSAAPTAGLPVATQSSGPSCFTGTHPRPSSSDPSVDQTTSPLASASSASATSNAARALVPPVVHPSSAPRSATRASVSVAVAPEVCTHDAITQLQHVVTAARTEYRSKEPVEQQRTAFAFLNKREMQKDIKKFAERTITNAYYPLYTRREEDRALLLQLFIETFLVET